jgi:hypothetical protein
MKHYLQETLFMRRYSIMMLAFVGMLLGTCLHADTDLAPVAMQKAPITQAATLTPDEQAFAAKLNDQNRKAFIEKLTAEQRRIAMAAAKASPIENAADDVVSQIAASEIINSEVAIADSETED